MGGGGTSETGKVGVTMAAAVRLGAIIGAAIFTLSGTAIALAGAGSSRRSSSWA